MNACTRKQIRHRSAVKIKSGEKTSEFRFQEFCKAIQYLFIHLSQLIRVSQLVPGVAEKFSFLSRNPVVEEVQNSETLFQFLEVDLEPISPILAGPVSHHQSYPSRKRAALSCFLSKVICFPGKVGSTYHNQSCLIKCICQKRAAPKYSAGQI
ncbi:Hypothetical_protein [Hexamita inflata]|uniref:Hypothetical_protein n=1 Tax=Hexamita inflata TaxID=28002 RepID=A0AA86THV5_9EUKA|nr:Hypothetical protein HINF_LOCUS4022 [Hexamita inflata]